MPQFWSSCARAPRGVGLGSAGNGAELPVLVAPLRLLPSALVEGPLAQAPQVLRTPLWPG